MGENFDLLRLDAEPSRRKNEMTIGCWLTSGDLKPSELDALDGWLERRRQDALAAAPLAFGIIGTVVTLVGLVLSYLGIIGVTALLSCLLAISILFLGLSQYAARVAANTARLQSRVAMQLTGLNPYQELGSSLSEKEQRVLTVRWRRSRSSR